MAKNIKDNSSLFKGFNPPDLNTSKKSESNKKVEKPKENIAEIEDKAPDEPSDIATKPESKEEIKPIIEAATLIKEVSKGGRPKKYNQDLKKLTVYLPEDDYMFLKYNCGRFDGMNGYIIHLIEKEMNRHPSPTTTAAQSMNILFEK